ncbi:MAG: single-stranded-DNA-specific exonuclease RecJ [Anaerolineales bacterium]|nr:single-stranded-DNA-specific exonuclease RecJ [Anaerolineales bacterium]
MTLLGTRWQIAEPPPENFLKQFKRINPLLMQVMYNRGITKPNEIKDFLTHQFIGADDPFLLQDMQLAVDRIKKAIDHKESIAIYGDYDADGVTGAVVLVQALRAMGAERVQPYIPHRIDEGYGLNEDALEFLASSGNTLVITVDCGVRAVDQVKHSARFGLDVIITDHHTVGSELPPAVAIIDPKRPGNEYPDPMLAGVGVAYKLVQGLVRTGIDLQGMHETDLLDLVALGTVADLAPLIKENRVLVQQGLEIIQQARRPGLVALMRKAGINPEKVSASTIGYAIGPRINAAGRMGHAYQAARLLITDKPQRARELADSLDSLNQLRRDKTQKLTVVAEELATREPIDSPLLFAAHEDFPSGVVGLIANRLQEKHYRPAIVAKISQDEIVGSCRSIPEFHITEALDLCQDILVKHGGHAAAAGFTVKPENLDELKHRLAKLSREQLEGINLIPSMNIDAELSVKDIIWEVQEAMARLEPCGYGNPTPLLYSPSVQIRNCRKVGSDGAHLKLMFEQDGRQFDGIAFRMGDKESQVEECMDIVYLLEVNEWNGRTSMQLNIQDMRPASKPSLTILSGKETNE